MAAMKTIMAMVQCPSGIDRKLFSAGLLVLLQLYPDQIIERAGDPARGIPSVVKFLNMADIKSYLERWADELHTDEKRSAIRRRIEEPQLDAETITRMTAKANETLAVLREASLNPMDRSRDENWKKYEKRILEMEAGSRPVWDGKYKPTKALLKALQEQCNEPGSQSPVR